MRSRWRWEPAPRRLPRASSIRRARVSAISAPAVAARDAGLAALAAEGRATELAARLDLIAHDGTLEDVAQEWLLDRGLHALARLSPTPAARATVIRLTARAPTVYARVDPDHGERATPLYDAGATARFVLRTWERVAARAAAAAGLAARDARIAARFARESSDAARAGTADAFRGAPLDEIAAQRHAVASALAEGRRVDALALIVAERLADPALFGLARRLRRRAGGARGNRHGAARARCGFGARGARAREPARGHRLRRGPRRGPARRARRRRAPLPVRGTGGSRHRRRPRQRRSGRSAIPASAPRSGGASRPRAPTASGNCCCWRCASTRIPPPAPSSSALRAPGRVRRNCRPRRAGGSSDEPRGPRRAALRRCPAGVRRLHLRQRRRDHESVRPGLRRRALHLYGRRQHGHRHRARLPAARAGRLDDAGRGLSRVRLAVRAAPVAVRAERRGGRPGRRPDARGTRDLGLRDRRSGCDDRRGLHGARRAGERRHPRARVADARSRDRVVRGAGRGQGGRRLRAVPGREPEHGARAGEQRGRLPADAALPGERDGRPRAAARRPHAAQEPAQSRRRTASSIPRSPRSRTTSGASTSTATRRRASASRARARRS